MRSGLRRAPALLLAAALLVTGHSTAAAASAAAPPSAPPAIAGPSNTGVPAGTRLTKRYSDLRITKPGTVIDGLEVHGLIWVEAPDVTIRNTIVRGRTIRSNIGLINAHSPAVRNLVVEDVELAPSVRSVHWTGIYGSNLTVRRADIHDVVDAVHVFGNDVTVHDSWFHDLSHFDYDPWHKAPSKEDGIEIVRGERIDIRRNTMGGATNAAIMVTQGLGRVRGLTIADNVLSNGSCSVNITHRGGTPITGLAITGNLFGPSKSNCNVVVDTGTKALATITGNRRMDGRPMTVFGR